MQCDRLFSEKLNDTEEESIIAIDETQRIEIFSGNSPLPILRDIPLELTVIQIFEWLNLG